MALLRHALAGALAGAGPDTPGALSPGEVTVLERTDGLAVEGELPGGLVGRLLHCGLLLSRVSPTGVGLLSQVLPVGLRGPRDLLASDIVGGRPWGSSIPSPAASSSSSPARGAWARPRSRRCWAGSSSRRAAGCWSSRPVRAQTPTRCSGSPRPAAR